MKLPDPAKLKIVTYPDSRLRRSCQRVDVFDERLDGLAARMLKLMHESNGIGLAAPQVGLPLRLFVCNITGEPGDDRVYVNPEIDEADGLAAMEEGCLSLPDVRVTVRRPSRCMIRAQDLRGQSFEQSGEGLLARCWQHETDHLDGRMIVDYMSEADKIANRRILRQLEAQYQAARPAKSR